MEFNSFFHIKNLFKNLLKINSVGDYIWSRPWGHFEIVFIPIICLIGIVLNKTHVHQSMSVTGLITLFLIVIAGFLILVKSLRSVSSISRKTFEAQQALYKKVYFIYMFIYYAVSAGIFTIIYYLM